MFKKSFNCPRWDYVQLFTSGSYNHECCNIIVSTFQDTFRWETFVQVYTVLNGFQCLKLSLDLSWLVIYPKIDIIPDLCCTSLLQNLLIRWLNSWMEQIYHRECVKIHFCYLLAVVWPLPKYLTSLVRGFLMDKINIIVIVTVVLSEFYGFFENQIRNIHKIGL